MQRKPLERRLISSLASAFSPRQTMRRPLLSVLLGTAALMAAPFLAPSTARAHAIESELSNLGGQAIPHSHPHPEAGVTRLQLSSAFSTGQPASHAAVRLVPAPGAKPVELGHTDAQGRLAFALPARTGPEAEIQVDAGAGHRDWIGLNELTHTHAASTGGSGGSLAHHPWKALTGTLLSLAPIAGLGLLGGLVLRRRPRS